ncbi:DUF6602 domain-containing protein [Janthinobacterium kumbetense]|uniref:DUF6602 domain-containing protein n=1 Tax=Janthinobacterium kumbetense TaxID=2950280 RepID=A0ABT0WV07_9BURK|nr:DUF6602 domain-containing protein [Janthinobacterium kumbetense]MCM2567787.1 hypothetical protein [Janthinobacterium kumbetense]
MAIENQYQKIFRSRVESALLKAAATSKISHQGVKGSILEILIADLFSPLLPSDIGVGTGQITDSYSGILSNQIDIILYDKSILPPIFFDRKLGIFPIESVLYAIEVKTTLNIKELRLAHESAKNLHDNFFYRPGQQDKDGNEINHKIERVRSAIFALRSDLKGTGITEAQRYKNIYSNEYPFIRAICIAGKEYWYEKEDEWIGTTKQSGYDEILAFIGGVTNTYRRISESRGRPSLGHYIIPNLRSTTREKHTKNFSIFVTCEKCGISGEFTPIVPNMDLTINGAIIAEKKCPSCSGPMKSKPGNYHFIDGKIASQ